MALNPRVALRIAAVLLPALLAATGAAALESQLADRTMGSIEPPAALATKPWPAPVGHRQPRAAEIPANAAKHEADAWLQRLNREIDSRLWLCRGC